MCCSADILAILKGYGMSGAVHVSLSCQNLMLAQMLIVLHGATGFVALTRQADEECLSLLQARKS